MTNNINKILNIQNAQNGFVLIPNNSFFSSENRLEYLINFKGSSGLCYFEISNSSIKSISLFVDGRYIEEAYNIKKTFDKDELNIEFEAIEINDHNNWIKKNSNNRLCIDLDLFTQDHINLYSHYFDIAPFQRSIINSKWLDRFDFHQVQKVDFIKIPKEISEEKISQIESIKKTAPYITCDDQIIAWILNIRKKSINPGINGILIIDEQINIFTNYSDKISNFIKNEQIKILPEPNFHEYIQNTKHNQYQTDIKSAPASMIKFFQENNIDLIDINCPFELIKSIKTNKEINEIRKIHEIDGASIIKFMYWIEINSNQKLTEIECSQKLSEIKAQNKEFICESFETIFCSDENSSKIHGKPTSKIVENFYLLDSGGQYLYGTTDNTRTVALNNPSESQKFHYTLVLKGNIELSQVIFKKNTNGSNLDILARKYLWKNGIDYNHSTGHGVGFFLNVHEGPQGINMKNIQKLIEGMIVSNEPGCYIEKNYGIRIENLMLIKKSKFEEYLEFETISLTPFCNKLIDYKMLTDQEVNWIKGYYDKIKTATFRYLNKDEFNWLMKQIDDFDKNVDLNQEF